MFTQAALRASVFVLKRFFLSHSVFWLGRVFAFFSRLAEAWLYRHCKRQFSTTRNRFSGVLGAQSRLGEHGPLNSSKLRYQLGHFYSNEISYLLPLLETVSKGVFEMAWKIIVLSYCKILKHWLWRRMIALKHCLFFGVKWFNFVTLE